MSSHSFKYNYRNLGCTSSTGETIYMLQNQEWYTHCDNRRFPWDHVTVAREELQMDRKLHQYWHDPEHGQWLPNWGFIPHPLQDCFSSPHLPAKTITTIPMYHCWQNTLKPNLPPLKNQHDITGIIYPTLSFGRIIWSRTHWNLLTLFSVNQIKHRKHFHLNIQLHIARNTIQLQQWPHLFVNNTRGASG